MQLFALIQERLKRALVSAEVSLREARRDWQAAMIHKIEVEI
jgi:hypothetical protein